MNDPSRFVGRRRVPDPEAWVGTERVAKHLDVSIKTVRRLVQRGLPHVRVGGQLRFRLSEVDAWLLVDRDQ